MKRTVLIAALAGTIVVAGTAAASADVNDSWITTKAKITLLTMDGFSVNGANIDTVDGNVTMHGEVATTEGRTRAEQTVRKVSGGKTVNNLREDALLPGLEGDGLGAPYDETTRKLRMWILPKGRQADRV